MRKVIGTGIGLVLSIIIAAVMGYWNPRGVVALGDARIPAWPVGILGVVSGAITGLAGGSETARRVLGRLLPSESVLKASNGPQTGYLGRVPGLIPVSAGNAVGSVPETVRHLNDCLYHLRVVLADDAEGQDLLDQISVKVGRKTTLNAVKTVGAVKESVQS